MSQLTNDFVECKKLIDHTFEECMAYSAWCGHESAVNYLKDEYNYIVKFAKKYNLDISTFTKIYKESEDYENEIFNGQNSEPTYEQIDKLNKLDNSLIMGFFDVIELFNNYINNYVIDNFYIHKEDIAYISFELNDATINCPLTMADKLIGQIINTTVQAGEYDNYIDDTDLSTPERLLCTYFVNMNMLLTREITVKDEQGITGDIRIYCKDYDTDEYWSKLELKIKEKLLEYGG